MDESDLMSLLQSLPPEALDQMIQAVTAGQRVGVAGERAQRGYELADTQQPEAMHVGNTVVARSPLEHFAAALRQGMGTYDARKQRMLQDQAIEQMGQGRLAYLRGIAGQRPPAVPAAPDYQSQVMPLIPEG